MFALTQAKLGQQVKGLIHHEELDSEFLTTGEKFFVADLYLHMSDYDSACKYFEVTILVDYDPNYLIHYEYALFTFYHENKHTLAIDLMQGISSSCKLAAKGPDLVSLFCELQGGNTQIEEKYQGYLNHLLYSMSINSNEA